MPITKSRIATAVLIATLAPVAHAEIKIDEIGGSTIGFEGLVQADSSWFDNDVADLNGGNGDNPESDLRRAELVLSGTGPGNFGWVVGYDAASDKWLDVNGKYKLGGGHFLQAGQYKQPNSMEELSSTKNNDFISKAATTNAFAISRRLGVAYGYGNDVWSITASAFGRELTDGGNHGSGHAVRGTFAPINTDGNILHLGASYTNRDTDGDRARVSAKPNADLASARLVDTGTFLDSDRLSTVGLESFWVSGPLKLQGEYSRIDVERYGTGSQDFDGSSGYLSAVYNLTGETWSYKSSGTPGTAKPAQPARGLWQAGLRYDTLDLNDGNVAGGEMDAVTAGVNWYWRNNFKLMVNYVMVDSERAGISDDPNILETRLQFFW